MCFSSTHGTFALHCVCCWRLPDYLHGLPGASQLLRVVVQSKSLTSWQLCFLLMALMWPVCFTHGCGWGIQRLCMQGNAALMFCFYTHRKSKWAMGQPYSVRESWSWSDKSIPFGIPDCSETTSCATVYAISVFNMPLLAPIVHLCVCAHLWVFNTTHR